MLLPFVYSASVGGETTKGVTVDEFNPESVIAEDSCVWTADGRMPIPLGGSLVLVMVWVPMTTLSTCSSLSFQS